MRMHTVFRWVAFCVIAICELVSFGDEPLDWVDPMLGTTGPAGMMPYVGEPFGAVQHVPMTRISEVGITSFDSKDRLLLGHVGSRQMAIWMGEWGQFSFQASAGLDMPPCAFADRGLVLDWEQCVFRPYYYRTVSEGVTTECSATSHAAIYRITFPSGLPPRFVVDASRDFTAIPLRRIGIAGDTNAAPGFVRLEAGNRRIIAWNRDCAERNLGPNPKQFRAHLVMEFSEPFVDFGTFSGGPERDADGPSRAISSIGQNVAR